MRCYNCWKPTTTNAMDELTEEAMDKIVDAFGLVHCIGEDDMFNEQGWVIICPSCVERVFPYPYRKKPALEEDHDKMLQYAQLVKDHCAQLSEFGYELVADAITHYAAGLAKSPIDDSTATNLLARLVLETREVVEQRKRLFRYGTLLDKYAGLTEAMGRAVDKELKNLKTRLEQQEETIAQLKNDMSTS